MVRRSLPPGFRFHPTDVELILYYLKRKIMGRKFHFEAIAEVNIYKYSPWDLPDKNLLKSKDLEWFFFCPREKKYASGVRVKRATENGYWKTTGKDRTISCNEKTVGTVKTLIFHLGHAPQGERTNWVIHEYRILDDQLAKAGVQDNYVLCKVFEKKGLGPKNGAQYGAPFSEEDWADEDDDTVAQNCAIPFTADGPCPTVLMQNEERSLPTGSGFFGSGNGSVPIPEEGPSSSSVVPSSMVAPDETTDDVMEHLLGIFVADNVSQNCDIPLAADGPCPTLLMQNEGQCLPLGTGLFGSGNGSLPKPKEGCSSSALVPTRMVAEDDMLCLHGLVPDDDMMLSNGSVHKQDDLSGKGKKKSLPSLEGFDLYDGLHDLDIWTEIKDDRFNFSGVQNVDYSLNRMLPEDNSMYIELDDLLLPLDCSNGVAGTHLSSICQLDCPDGVAGTHLSSLYSLDCSNGFTGTPASHCQPSASYSLENMQQLYSGTRFSSMHQYTFSANDPAVLPYSSEGGDILNGLPMVEDHLFNEGPNDSYSFDLPFSQLENAGNTPHDMMERGPHLENVYTRLLECCIPAHILPSAAASTCGGSSIHIKAEVTHGAGECTDEALSVMMEGSSSCRCNSLFQPWFVLNLLDFVSRLILNACLSYVYFRILIDNFCHSNCSLRYEYAKLISPSSLLTSH